MNVFAETESVRLKETVTAQTILDGEIRTLATGTEGTIVDVLGGGRAFEVEFMIAPPRFDDCGEVVHGGVWHMITLTPQQIEPA